MSIVTIRDVDENAMVIKLKDFYVILLVICQILQTFRLLAYLRANWRDTRLMFPTTATSEKLILSPEIVKNIWVPDFYIQYLENLQITSVLTVNQGVIFSNQSKMIHMSNR